MPHLKEYQLATIPMYKMKDERTEPDGTVLHEWCVLIPEDAYAVEVVAQGGKPIIRCLIPTGLG